MTLAAGIWRRNRPIRRRSVRKMSPTDTDKAMRCVPSMIGNAYRDSAMAVPMGVASMALAMSTMVGMSVCLLSGADDLAKGAVVFDTGALDVIGDELLAFVVRERYLVVPAILRIAGDITAHRDGGRPGARVDRRVGEGRYVVEALSGVIEYIALFDANVV